MTAKQRLLLSVERNLTNYFTGQNKTTMNFNDKLQFNLKNNDQNSSATVALATGNIPVRGLVSVIDKDKGECNTLIHYHDTSALVRAGYPVDVVLDDMTDAEVVEGGIKFGEKSQANPQPCIFIQSVDSSLSIRHALDFLKLNPRFIKSITINTNNKALYSASLSVCSINPFHRENERSFNLNDYYSVNQYQDDKVVINFQPEQLEWNDMLYLAINGIPPQCEARICVEFY